MTGRLLGVLCGIWLTNWSLGYLGLVVWGVLRSLGTFVGHHEEAHSKELDRWLSQLALGISAEEATVPGAYPTLGLLPLLMANL